MRCKTCGNELNEVDKVCTVCGSEVPHTDNVGADASPSAGDDTTSDAISENAESTEGVWPWKAGEPAAYNDASTVSQEPSIELNTEPSLEATPQAPENMFVSSPSGSPNVGNKRFDFSWDNKDFQNEGKKKTEDINFDWGDVFTFRSAEQNQEPENIEPQQSGSTSIFADLLGPKTTEQQSDAPIFSTPETNPDLSINQDADYTGSVNTGSAENEDGFPVSEDDLDFSFAKPKESGKLADDKTKQYESPNFFSRQQDVLKTSPGQERAYATKAPFISSKPIETEEPDIEEPVSDYNTQDYDASDASEAPIAFTPSESPRTFSIPEPIKPFVIPEPTVSHETFTAPELSSTFAAPDASETFTIPKTPEFEVTPISKNPTTPEAPAKPFTAADIENLGIFDTEVASPFDTSKDKVASPFDLSDAEVASIFVRDPMDYDADASPKPSAAPAKSAFEIYSSVGAEEPKPEEPTYDIADDAAEKEELSTDQASKIQEIISQPVIFPFDEETGYVEPEPEPEPEEVSFDQPEDEVVTYTEPSDETEEGSVSEDEDEADIAATSSKDTSSEDTSDAYEDTDDIFYDDEPKRKKSKNKKSDKPEKSKHAKPDKADKLDKSDEAEETADGRKRHKGLVIFIDIMIVVVVLCIAAFALIKLAPDSGVAKFLNEGIAKVTGLFAGSDKSSTDTDTSTDDTGTSDGVEMIPPAIDKDALVRDQASFYNQNIIEVVYDAEAKYNSGFTYTMEGVKASKPIEDDYWTTDEQGPLLYDEAAVATVIRFNSALVLYTGGQQSDILAEVEKGSKEETALAEYTASLTALEFKRLGIGEIRTDGTYFYVFTNETVVETRNGTPTEVTSSKVYKLVPDISTMKISEIETVS